MGKEPLTFLAVALSSGFFISYLPARYTRVTPYLTGAGFLGTLEGVLFLWFLPQDPLLFAVILVASFFASVALSARAEQALGVHDDPRIVIDEIIGVWITLAFLPRTAVVWVTGFVLFRILDCTKPLFIRKAAKLPGGWGIVADDALAGVVANLLIRAAMASSIL